jgi:hypothetical protein
MNDSYDLNSILNAIEDINSIKKKQIYYNEKKEVEKIKKKISPNNEVLPITEKLILEAEEHSNNLKKINLNKPITTNDILVLNNEYKEQNLDLIDLEEIKIGIINDLYSSLSKKIKKNTLKTIFDLRHKINTLEKENKILKIDEKNKLFVPADSTVNDKEHFINEENFNSDSEFFNENPNNNLSDEIIKTLEFQEKRIKKFESNEETLRLQIVDLEQDLNLLKKNKTDT